MCRTDTFLKNDFRRMVRQSLEFGNAGGTEAMSSEIITFLRKKDYRPVRELEQGGCGKTLLIYDDIIDEHFVCKKYSPHGPTLRDDLFKNFLNEIKLMHKVWHKNIVRVFYYYVYPKQSAGYIIMEYIEGETIDKYVDANPDLSKSIFRQTIDAFCYLEEAGILHRDIRFQNILVRNDGVVKVIDLGFGKAANNSIDYHKSISLNWPFPTPYEFAEKRYDFSTEVYFVGMLFNHIIGSRKQINKNFSSLINNMCAPNSEKRWQSFTAVRDNINADDLVGRVSARFTQIEKEVYKAFASQLLAGISAIEPWCENITEVEEILSKLDDVHESCILKDEVPVRLVMYCLITGGDTWTRGAIELETLEAFIKMLRKAQPESKRIILRNLFTSLDAVERWEPNKIPF